MIDSVPTVFITGQVKTELIGTDGFQEADILGATLPFVKHSFQVTDPRQIPEYVHEAFHVASTGRPGPVLLDIPQDLSRADIDYEPRTEPVELPGYKPTTSRATSNRSGSPPKRWPTRAGRSSTPAAAWSTPTPPRSCASSPPPTASRSPRP